MLLRLSVDEYAALREAAAEEQRSLRCFGPDHYFASTGRPAGGSVWGAGGLIETRANIGGRLEFPLFSHATWRRNRHQKR